MNTNSLPVTRLSCKRCGYDWVPRTDQKPDVCPSCKSRKWDVARAADRAVEDLSPAQRRNVEAYLRVLRNGDPAQVRALAMMIEAQDSLLRHAEAAKAVRKAK